MNVNLNKSHELVTENNNKLSVTRGPLLYCIEGNDYQQLHHLYLEPSSYDEIKVDYHTDSVLKGIPYIKLPLYNDRDGNPEKTEAELIPYFSWNNRGDLPMLVWLNNGLKGGNK